MVCIYNACRIHQIAGIIHIDKTHQIFVVIVRNVLTMFINGTTQNCMCEWIARCCNFPVSVDKCLFCLCSNNRIKHYRKITACRVLHSGRNIHTAYSKSVLLVFNRTGTDCDIRKNICKEPVILRVEHLICRHKFGFFHDSYVHLADCYKPCKQIRLLFRVRLM